MKKKAVFFDANILYSWHLNHLLMFFCETGVGLIEPYWSELVVNEAVSNILKNTGDDVSERFEKMNIAYPYANIIDFEGLEDVPDVHSNDQHVAKAAIFNECDFLVTNNLKHFKFSSELQNKPKVVTPDTLLTAFAKKDPEKSFRATVLAWWHSVDDFSFDEYLHFLGRTEEGLKLLNFAACLNTHIQSLELTPHVAANSVTEHEKKRY